MTGSTVGRNLSGLAVLAALMVALGQPPARAGEAAPKGSWARQKCSYYARDWSESLRRLGSDGVSQEFRDGNAAFIARGCDSGATACPRSPKDLKLVDVLAILVVDQGMSTTFLPFHCRP